MITVSQYFGPWNDHKDVTEARRENADALLTDVNRLLNAAEQVGIKVPINPNTGSQVSGTTYGGFRPQLCPQGAPNSSHKEADGIDIYDPQNRLDDWINDDILEVYGLYREHPDSTHTWCHLTKRAPRSGRRSFFP